MSGEGTVAAFRDNQHPRRTPADPILGQRVIHQGGAKGTGQMRPAFGPIQAELSAVAPGR